MQIGSTKSLWTSQLTKDLPKWNPPFLVVAAGIGFHRDGILRSALPVHEEHHEVERKNVL